MFKSLIDCINNVLDLILDNAKLPASTTPETLVAMLTATVSLLTGQDPDTATDAADKNRQVGPSGAGGMAQMNAQMGKAGGDEIKDVPKVVGLLNRLLKAAKITESLDEKLKAEALPSRLTEIVMKAMKTRMGSESAKQDMVQMSGRMVPVNVRNREIIDYYESFKMTGKRPEVALRMARNVVCGRS